MFNPSSSNLLALALIALAGLGAQGPQQPVKPPAKPPVKFTGKTVPDPPRQKAPWTAPPTKLPRFLVSATSALFDEGMADPRGCEYREVEIAMGRNFKVRAFVLPDRPGEPCRFAVTWDGAVHPTTSVGPPADLDADVRELIESMRRIRQDAANGKAIRPARAAVFARAAGALPVQPASAHKYSPLKLCVLLRLDRAKLAEALFASGTTWSPEIQGRDLTNYYISYLTLAREWAARTFTRLIDAHTRGDDAIALDAARRLSAFAKAAEARALELGFERNPQGSGPLTYFPFLRQLPELLADQERRAREAPHGPVPPRGDDRAARVAALVRDLDQIAMSPMIGFGNAPNASPMVTALVAEGDAAVEPLLAAIESDTRLTRTVSHGRGVSIDRRVHPVLEFEFAALVGILKTGKFSGKEVEVERGTLARKDLARSMREYWTKNRAVPLVERWYRTLRNDSSGYDQWHEAANAIVQPADQGANPGALKPGEAPPLKGDELRSRRDPSVSELLARRALEIAHASRPRTLPDVELGHACELALLLDRWDPKAALPVVQDLMKQAIGSVDRDRSEGYGQLSPLEGRIARFTLIRVREGDAAALGEYAAEIRKWGPGWSGLFNLDPFEPIWVYPDDPAVREAARWLFNDPASPWAALLRNPGSPKMPFASDTKLYASPLLRSAGFREAVFDLLANRSELGTIRRSQKTMVEFELKGRLRGGFNATEADLEGVELGTDQKFRVCDYIACQVSAVTGAPRCELYWPKEARDEGVRACAEFLKIHGDRFAAEGPRDEFPKPFEARAYLTFPALDHPATLEDVRAGRAIFSLEGEEKVRRLKLPSMPLKARWAPPEAVPGTAPENGWVWQAEEVFKGGRWERYYGFVGRHIVAKIPRGSIELIESKTPVPVER